jgi:hypothetical protein
MRLLSASALWWLLLGAPIIFFYLLKLKRKRQVVPSVLLWQRALDEIEANAPFRRLRRSLLLFLQLLILAAVVFALARPLVTTRALASGSTVIVIDSTASMSARDQDGRSRLERARELALEMVDGLNGSDRAAIIESGTRVVVRSPLSADRDALANAIDEVHETGAAGSLTDALVLAEQIAKSERDAGIVVIGDGGSPNVAPERTRNPAAAGADTSLRFVRVGARADNCGIVAMNSRALQGGMRQELFAAIANFSSRDREIGVELRIDGRLVDVRTARLALNDRKALIYDSLPQSGGLAELKLDVDDDLDADNVAYAQMPDARKPRIAVASDNPFLLRALAVNPDFDARRIKTDEGDHSVVDCIVSDGLTGAAVLEGNRPLLVINPSDSEGLWRTTGELEKPEVVSVNRAHPVNDYLNYSDLHIEGASKREAASWLKPIVGTANDGLIWAGDDGGRRVVMIGFDLSKTDLPLKVEFPLLLANSISWLVGQDAGASERVVRAGQPITLRGTESIELTLPDGGSEEVRTEDGTATFADTLLVGIYSVKDAPPFAVTLLSEAESDTTPRDSISAREGEVSGQAETFQSEREAWRWIALAALLVMAIEWWVYHKRIAG